MVAVPPPPFWTVMVCYPTHQEVIQVKNMGTLGALLEEHKLPGRMFAVWYGAALPSHTVVVPPRFSTLDVIKVHKQHWPRQLLAARSERKEVKRADIHFMCTNEKKLAWLPLRPLLDYRTDTKRRAMYRPVVPLTHEHYDTVLKATEHCYETKVPEATPGWSANYRSVLDLRGIIYVVFIETEKGRFIPYVGKANGGMGQKKTNEKTAGGIRSRWISQGGSHVRCIDILCAEAAPDFETLSGMQRCDLAMAVALIRGLRVILTIVDALIPTAELNKVETEWMHRLGSLTGDNPLNVLVSDKDVPVTPS